MLFLATCEGRKVFERTSFCVCVKFGSGGKLHRIEQCSIGASPWMSGGAIPPHRTSDKAQPTISDWIEAMRWRRGKTLDCLERQAHKQTAATVVVGGD